METDLRTAIDRVDDVVRLRVAGDVDLLSYSRLDAALTNAISVATRAVEVDLLEVTFFGSEGARSLTSAWSDARARHVEISVVAASRMVRQVLHIFEMCPLLAC